MFHAGPSARGLCVDAINPTIELSATERRDRLRLIRSDNVGPRTCESAALDLLKRKYCSQYPCTQFVFLHMRAVVLM
ncbi:hypothetical protein BRAO375_3550006 [Bradyrhizobium sp. ORS 375]|nr:hypothetical protein BRAO375_3550006 [Bradyrhizobium sp. ORS 375]